MEIQTKRKTEMNVIEKTRVVASNAKEWSVSKIRTVIAIATAGAAAAAAPAHAAAVDVAAVVTDIGAQAAPIGLIGAAVLLIYVGVKAFQWVRKALS
jgi:hypothetical protein